MINDNVLLGTLPEAELEQIRPHLKMERLPVGRTLFPPNGEPNRFYFLTSGLVSLLYSTEDDCSAEISVVGREGGIGLSLIMAGRPFPVHAIVQAQCTAASLPADPVREVFARGGRFQRNVLHFTHALMTQMAHTVVCNRHHSVELQYCRWILLSHDRIEDDTLDMTQETIARMLGVRRAGVNEAASRLQREGLIEQRRGQVRILDREGLEGRCCECYRVISGEYRHYLDEVTKGTGVMPPASPQPSRLSG